MDVGSRAGDGDHQGPLGAGGVLPLGLGAQCVDTQQGVTICKCLISPFSSQRSSVSEPALIFGLCFLQRRARPLRAGVVSTGSVCRPGGAGRGRHWGSGSVFVPVSAVYCGNCECVCKQRGRGMTAPASVGGFLLSSASLLASSLSQVLQSQPRR